MDHFVFAAKKGQRYVIEAHTHDLYSPAEMYMVLKNAMGNQVAATNPAADPRIDFTAPADGDYTLAVDHLLNLGGPGGTSGLALRSSTAAGTFGAAGWPALMVALPVMPGGPTTLSSSGPA